MLAISLTKAENILLLLLSKKGRLKNLNLFLRKTQLLISNLQATK